MNKLFWITDGDERYLGDASYLMPKAKKETATIANTTLEELSDHCDQEAEGANYHRFVGVHKKLGKLIAQKSSVEVAKEVMFEISLAGGLHEFND